MRTPINTTFSARVKPTTAYSKPRNIGRQYITADMTIYTIDSTSLTADVTYLDLGEITTVYNTPRQGYFLEDLLNTQVMDLDGDEVMTISGAGGKTAGINTNWT